MITERDYIWGSYVWNMFDFALRDGLMTDAIANGCGCITRLLCSFGFEQKHVVVYVSTP